jgi:hypothetical protein
MKRTKKSISVSEKNSLVQDDELKNNSTTDKVELKIYGFRIERSDKEPELNDGVPEVRSGTKVVLRLFGTGITKDTSITFTEQTGNYRDACYLTIPNKFKVFILYFYL